MSVNELEKLEDLLTSWIVELDSTNRPTLAHNARLVRESIVNRIGELN